MKVRIAMLTGFSLLLTACGDSYKDVKELQLSGRKTYASENEGASAAASVSIQVSGDFRKRQKDLSAQINQIAREVGADPYFVHAIISAESAYISCARSHVGAKGLMQLMPGTAKEVGVTDVCNTGQNIKGGSIYLTRKLKEFNGNMQLAAAAYNAGAGSVRKYGNRIPPFAETQAYVPKVMSYYRKYKSDPSLIGLGVGDEYAASECDQREVCTRR